MTRWSVITNERTHMVVDRGSGRALGGFGSNFYRPWVFPLYTPAGKTVIQEFAFDHPFHNGFFVAQNPVEFPGGTANFWATPPRRSDDDALFAVPPGRMHDEGDLTSTPSENGASFDLTLTWRDSAEQPVLRERRSVRFTATEDATICEMASEKQAAFGPLTFPRTKFGSIGIRVEPRLLPPLGGTVIADGVRGTADVGHESSAAAIAYERGNADGNGFGVMLMRPDPVSPGPWFIRDYGMALWNPTWSGPISVPEGETWRVALRVIAYDGEATMERETRWRGVPCLV